MTWIEVSDELPEIGQWVLLYSPLEEDEVILSGCLVGCRIHRHWWTINRSDYSPLPLDVITYWAELPPLPGR